MTLQKLYELTQNNIFYDAGYDVAKIMLGFIFAKLIYDKFFMKLRWGGWQIRLQKGEKVYFTRAISPSVAKRIFSDGADFSVFVKGVASTTFWVNQMDMSLENVNKTDLLQKDDNKKLIIIDEAANPPKPRKPSTEDIMNKLDELEAKFKIS